MSNTTDYKAKIDEIMAIKKDDIKNPNIPVDKFLQEAEDLFHWAKDDEDQLQANGLEKGFIDELPIRAGACREAQSKWIKEWKMHKEPEKNWEEMCKNAEFLKKKLLHAFDYAYRKDEGLLKKITFIRKGSGHTDTIQDLNDLAVLGKTNPESLKKINFDMTLLDASAEMADSMASSLAIVNGEKLVDNKVRIIRDKAYTFLKEAVDEVRACGKYVFWDNKDRLKGYVSRYYQHKKKKTKETNGEDENVD